MIEKDWQKGCSILLKLFKKFIVYFLFFFLILIVLFFNLGKFLDISQEPIKSDVIFCLGGGEKERLLKAIELYETNFSRNNIIILTGNDKKIYLENYIKNHNINLIREINTKSTEEEVKFIKNYLTKNALSEAIIVTDAPHTRRIQYLINKINLTENDKYLKFHLVKTNNNWWDKKYYFLNKKAQIFVLSESLKITYSFIKYDLFVRFGLTKYFNETLTPFAEKLKKQFDSIIHIYQKK